MDKSRKFKSAVFAFVSLLLGANLSGCASAIVTSTDPTEQPIIDGTQMIKDQKYLDAVEKFSQVIDLKPKLPIGYTKRGVAETALHRYDKALKDLNQAISLDPVDAEAYCARGMVYNQNGDAKKAYEDLQKAAGIYLKQGKKDECDKVVQELDHISGVQH